MRRQRTDTIRYAAARAAGFVVIIAVAALVLALAMPAGGTHPVQTAAALLLGDLGIAVSGEPVGMLISQRLAVTLPLASVSLALAAVVGTTLGYLVARRAGAVLKSGALAIVRIGAALPAFWLGMVLVVVVAGVFRAASPGGFVPWEQDPGGAIASLLLPTIALAVPLAALFARATVARFEAIETYPPVVTGLLLGYDPGVAIRRFAWTESLSPLVGLAAALAGSALAGAMIVENVFYLPGLGRLLVSAVAGEDFAVIRATLLIVVAVAAAARLGGGLVQSMLDPRVTAGQR